MATLSKRVQILLPPEQYSRLQAIARSEGESVGSLIRHAIEDVYFRSEEQDRLDAVRRLGAMSLPVADWEQMERESLSEERPSV
jgi:hypothetical protein